MPTLDLIAIGDDFIGTGDYNLLAIGTDVVEIPTAFDPLEILPSMKQRKVAGRAGVYKFTIELDEVPFGGLLDWVVKVAIADRFGAVADTVLDCTVTDFLGGVIESEEWEPDPANTQVCVSVYRTDVPDLLANAIVELRKVVV